MTVTTFPLINTAAGTDFSSSWVSCSSLTTFPLLDTAAGTTFDSAWSGCTALTSFPLINTGSATIFNYTWVNCSALTAFPLINTTGGTSFRYTWYGCSGLTNFPLVNTAAGTNFLATWQGCSSLVDFPTLNLAHMTNGNSCFAGVTLSRNSYSNLLIALAAQNTNSGVTFGAGNSTYSLAAVSARSTLTGTRGWNITDGGQSSIEWSNPSGIIYGTALSLTQLNALSDVAGSFTYTPPLGSVLHAGSAQVLSATFTPTDTVTYSTVTIARFIDVAKATLTLTAVNATMTAGQKVPILMAVGSGFVSPDTVAVFDTAPIITTTATSSSAAGTYPITVSGAVDVDYNMTFINGTMTVTPLGGGSTSGGSSGSSSGGCGLGGGLATLLLGLVVAVRLTFKAASGTIGTSKS